MEVILCILPVIIITGGVLIFTLKATDKMKPESDGLEWEDFNMAYEMRLVNASRSSYNGYKFLVYQSSPFHCTLRIKDKHGRLV